MSSDILRADLERTKTRGSYANHNAREVAEKHGARKNEYRTI